MPGIAYNDLVSSSRTWTADATGVDLTSGVACRVLSVAVTAKVDSDSSVSIFNATATSGSADFIVGASTGAAEQWIFEPCGIRFDTGLSIDTTGTPQSILVTYLVENE